MALTFQAIFYYLSSHWVKPSQPIYLGGHFYCALFLYRVTKAFSQHTPIASIELHRLCCKCVLSEFSIQKTMSGALSKAGVRLPDIYQIIYNVDRQVEIMKSEENINLEKYKTHSSS